MYIMSNWICTHNSRHMFVKIVYPGGHVEVYDRPILAAELLQRNPKCCVAHPTVFQEPYAVVSPSATLTLGQKYYIVPIATVIKLQLKYSALQTHRRDIQSNDKSGKTDGDDHMKMDDSPSCWLMRSNKNVQRAKNGVKVWSKDDKNFSHMKVVGIGGKRSSPLTSFDHWKPGLESIMEDV